MKKRFLTKVLAIVMCAGLIMQPVTAFAEEPSEDAIVVDEEILADLEIAETADVIEEEPETLEVAEEEPEIAEVAEDDSEIAEVAEENPEIAEASENVPEIGLASEDVTAVADRAANGAKTIKNISVTSDFNSVFVPGGNVRDPKVTYSGDLPLYVSSNSWEILYDDGWGPCIDNVFLGGTYRFSVSVRVEFGYFNDYKLDPNMTITVDGVDFALTRSSTLGTDSIEMATFTSKEYTMEEYIPPEPIEKTKITSVGLQSDYQDIPKCDEYVRAASFEILDVDPVEIYGYWYKEEADTWVECIDTVFVPGKYRYQFNVQVDHEVLKSYELDPSFELIVNGNKWTKLTRFDETTDIMTFVSEEFQVEEKIVVESGHWYSLYGVTYYEYPDGEKATGTQEIDGDYYLFSQNGALQTNVFYEIYGSKCYFGSDGKLVIGWFEKWSAKYYSDEKGVVRTGFVDIGEDTYYFDSKGKMTSSVWIIVDGKRYYSKTDGRIAKSETIYRWGKKYTFDEDGVLIQ